MTKEHLQSPLDVSIIIVNWNSIAYLEECVASIFDCTSDLSFEVIVVDNASPSGEADLLERRLPNVKVIKSSKNLGFAGANNLGFAESIGQYIVFLNPDTKLEGPAIKLMLRSLRSLPDAGILGCQLLNTDLSLQTSCVQTFPTILNQLLDSNWLRELWPNCGLWGTRSLFSSSSEPAEVEVISGACMMVGRDVFNKVGHFSEDYFMYAEDLDLCYKTRRAGYSNYYLGTATIIHHGGKSTNPEYGTRMKWKSILHFCKKYKGRGYASAFRVAMSLAAIFRLFALSVVRLFENRSNQPNSSQDSFTKWKLILSTIALPSAATTVHRPLPECTASQR
jgi:GT2 family glycosyltransferase